MHFRFALLVQFSVASVLLAGCAGPPALPPEKTLSVDPVELVRGSEVPGYPELMLEREGVGYLFSSPANRAEFVKHPSKYEVADGGACGRMGALSGKGDARRYAVHDGRIYFFASDGCRAGFLRNPSASIENDDAPPVGTPETAEQGIAILNRAVAWAGGRDRLRAVRSYRESAQRIEKSGDKDWTVTTVFAAKFPGRAFHLESWNDSWFATDERGGRATMMSGQGDEPMAAARMRAFDRFNARRAVTILKACADGADGLVCVSAGVGEVNGVAVEYVLVGLNGATSRLGVAKADGRPVSLSFRGRDGTQSVGQSVRTYTRSAAVAGVTLPTAYTVAFDGKDAPRSGATVDAFEINPPLATDLAASFRK